MLLHVNANITASSQGSRELLQLFTILSFLFIILFQFADVDTSGSTTSEMGGAKFFPKFLNDLCLDVSQKNFSISPKNFICLPKFLMTFCHVVSCFFSVGGAKFVADIDTGEGPKSLHFDKFTMLSLLFLPSRGPNSIANFDGGPCPDLPPPSIHHCTWMAVVAFDIHHNLSKY